MNLMERIRPAPPIPLPEGAQLGHRWPAFSRQKRTDIGLDIGAGGIKLVQVRWHREGPRLENYAIVPVPSSILDEGAVRNPEATADLLVATFKALGITRTTVGITVGGPAIMMRYITLPKVSEAEMHSAMKFEAPQHLPIPEEELVYDFTLVPEATGLGENQMAVFLAGTNARLIESFMAALNRAELRPTAIELDCLAVYRSLQWTGLVPHESLQPLVLLDIGEVGTRVSILRYGVPLLARTIPTGLYHLRAAIADTAQIPLAGAEQLLRAKGLEQDRELRTALEPLLVTLLESISRSIEFFLIQNRNASLERIFITGGGASLPHLPEVLTRHLQETLGPRGDAEQIKVQPAGLAGLDINPVLLPDVNAHGPLLLTALGSALREG